MSRTNIDFGIDLGTTNSEIAVFNGAGIDIVQNSDGLESTPSAVWIDESGTLRVGEKAKYQHAIEPGDARIEFKRLMGSAEPVTFRSSGRSLTPEALSAEILKNLRDNVKEWLEEEVTSAVITVPAMFTGAATDATIRAARLAGFETSPLLQEPTAAAIAHGFRERTQGSARWLVYDLGGGTFDAALVENDHGELRAIGCGGNDKLGGKDIDAFILNRVLLPALQEEFGPHKGDPNDPVWRAVIARLQSEAETAKIALSRRTTFKLDIRNLTLPGAARPVDFEYDLTRDTVARLAEPLIARTISLCKSELTKHRLAPSAFEKLILVGGPTLMPCVRDMLKDASAGLGIPMDDDGPDPFTVVARGAAIYAATQPLGQPRAVASGEYRVDLDYKAVGPDPDFDVGGRVRGAEEQDFSGFTIEFVNADAQPPWRSGKLPLAAGGGFLTTAWAHEGRKNVYAIHLLDAAGARQKVAPNEFSYLVGIGAGAQTLIHNIGIGYADNSVGLVFEAGTPLPTSRKRKIVVRTDRDIRRGTDEGVNIPIVEGREERADRNEKFDSITIPARDFRMDLPAGTEVELTLWMDESRRCFAQVYVPILKEDFEFQLQRHTSRISVSQLATDLELERERLDRLRSDAAKVNDGEVLEMLRRIDAEELESAVEATLEAAYVDPDAAGTCASRLRDLQVSLDQVEAWLRTPLLIHDAERLMRFGQAQADANGTAEEKARMPAYIQAVRAALSARDMQALKIRNLELQGFAYAIFGRTPAGIKRRFQWMLDDRHRMSDPVAAEKLFAEGRAALAQGDTVLLNTINNQLAALRPVGARDGSFDESNVRKGEKG